MHCTWSRKCYFVVKVFVGDEELYKKINYCNKKFALYFHKLATYMYNENKVRIFSRDN